MIIDHFLVRKISRADVKMIRGAEIGSSHYLVVIKMKMKLVLAAGKRARRGRVNPGEETERVGNMNEIHMQ